MSSPYGTSQDSWTGCEVPSAARKPCAVQMARFRPCRCWAPGSWTSDAPIFFGQFSRENPWKSPIWIGKYRKIDDKTYKILLMWGTSWKINCHLPWLIAKACYWLNSSTKEESQENRFLKPQLPLIWVIVFVGYSNYARLQGLQEYISIHRINYLLKSVDEMVLAGETNRTNSVNIWLVVSTPLKNISQMGLWFPIYGKIKNVPNHQPGIYTNSPTVSDSQLSCTTYIYIAGSTRLSQNLRGLKLRLTYPWVIKRGNGKCLKFLKMETFIENDLNWSFPVPSRYLT